MTHTATSGRVGIVLAGGASAILVARELLSLTGVAPIDTPSSSAGAIAAFAALAVGMALLAPRRRGVTVPTEQTPTRIIQPSARTVDDVRQLSEFAHALHKFLIATPMTEPQWPAFDQFVREAMAESFDALRIRAYLVTPGAEKLRPLSGGENRAGDIDLHSRGGLLGHVVSTGIAYYAFDKHHGELSHKLAESEQRWQIVWPIRDGHATVGVIAVGEAFRLAELSLGMRDLLQNMLSQTWMHVACRERLRIAEFTDKGSGVLTRRDFFDAAETAINGARDEREPVVVAVMTIEGLRRLDDHGAWDTRDQLIERIGRSLARHLRTDDVVGRFSDDRFAILLRRVDLALGKLIADKLLECVSGEVGAVQPNDPVMTRCGLVGNAAHDRTLDDMLIAAFSAAERAREQSLTVVSESHNTTLVGAGR
ncbi:MAG: GGDEF domain-containing protein [Phycisphaerae bacterium]